MGDEGEVVRDGLGVGNAQPRARGAALPGGHLLMWIVGVVLPLALITLGPFLGLVKRWLTDIECAQGLFVVPLTGYFIWDRRKELMRMEARPSWLGLPVVVLGVAGAVVTGLSPSLLRANLSLILIVMGLVITLAGWRRFGAIALPLAYLFFMLPMPADFRTKVAVPLQLFASDAGALVLRTFGVPVYREGNMIELAGQSLEVGQACSGISLLMGFLALGFVFAYLSSRRTWFRAVLFASTVPIALLINVVRVAGTGLIYQYLDPKLGQGFLHLFEGYMLFLVGIAFFFVEYRLVLFLADQLEVETACEGGRAG